MLISWASQVALLVKNSLVNAGDVRTAGSIPASGRSRGRENGNLLQHFRLENPTDREACQVTAYRVAESDTSEAT